MTGICRLGRDELETRKEQRINGVARDLCMARRSSRVQGKEGSGRVKINWVATEWRVAHLKNYQGGGQGNKSRLARQREEAGAEWAPMYSRDTWLCSPKQSFPATLHGALI